MIRREGQLMPGQGDRFNVRVHNALAHQARRLNLMEPLLVKVLPQTLQQLGPLGDVIGVGTEMPLSF